MSVCRLILELIRHGRFASRMKPSLIPLFLIANLLPGCTTTGSNPVADMPSWMGGATSWRAAEARHTGL
jgi:hypothetical protein